jgi:hypothetical protein
MQASRPLITEQESSRFFEQYLSAYCEKVR